MDLEHNQYDHGSLADQMALGKLYFEATKRNHSLTQYGAVLDNLFAMTDQSSNNSASIQDKDALLADRNDVNRINDESYDNNNTFDGSLLESAVEMANIDGQQRNNAYLINDRVDKNIAPFEGNSNFIDPQVALIVTNINDKVYDDKYSSLDGLDNDATEKRKLSILRNTLTQFNNEYQYSDDYQQVTDKCGLDDTNPIQDDEAFNTMLAVDKIMDRKAQIGQDFKKEPDRFSLAQNTNDDRLEMYHEHRADVVEGLRAGFTTDEEPWDQDNLLQTSFHVGELISNSLDGEEGISQDTREALKHMACNYTYHQIDDALTRTDAYVFDTEEPFTLDHTMDVTGMIEDPMVRSEFATGVLGTHDATKDLFEVARDNRREKPVYPKVVKEALTDIKSGKLDTLDDSDAKQWVNPDDFSTLKQECRDYAEIKNQRSIKNVVKGINLATKVDEKSEKDVGVDIKPAKEVQKENAVKPKKVHHKRQTKSNDGPEM